MECSDKTYHKNDFGFAKKCTCLDAVHVNFGNLSLLLTRAQIREFSSYITETLIAEYYVSDHHERCIYIPTRDHSMMFVMSYTELEKLSEILEHTLLMMEVEDLLEP